MLLGSEMFLDQRWLSLQLALIGHSNLSSLALDFFVFLQIFLLNIYLKIIFTLQIFFFWLIWGTRNFLPSFKFSSKFWLIKFLLFIVFIWIFSALYFILDYCLLYFFLTSILGWFLLTFLTLPLFVLWVI